MTWLIPLTISILAVAWAASLFIRGWFGYPPYSIIVGALQTIGRLVVAIIVILAAWLAWAVLAPARAQPAQCLPLEAFVVQQVEPVRAAGIPIITLTDAWEVGRYLEAVNRQPPETDLKAEGLIIGVAANVVVVALVERGHVCSVIQLSIPVHSDALLAAKRGA